ncbi:hypothetical protein [Zobellella iuensis]|uniref:DUF4907 domain-containing protein n=1 Tax=Zobellella iuensis TaxID=2803811 RepID=A0ABS1QPJ2_9GAMM|nr:hypothetical protein [Zobellella iuensis]MBL1376068.1 hypothetical protein [Zobellella iuensis]
MSCRYCHRWHALLLCLVLATTVHANIPRWLELAPGEPSIYISGTIRYLNLEGGLYVIRDIRGTHYHPLNLPPAFEQDGLAIEALARLRNDGLPAGLVGPRIELLHIRRASRLE